jgi:hypothetical protein
MSIDKVYNKINDLRAYEFYKCKGHLKKTGLILTKDYLN